VPNQSNISSSLLPEENAWFSSQEGFREIDTLGNARTPFLFIISYDQQKIFVQPLDDLDNDIYYKLETWRNYPVKKREKGFDFSKQPVAFVRYQKALAKVHEEIRQGNTYLLNLTFKTPIETELSLKEIFTYARAKFKLYFKDQFVCFMPEPSSSSISKTNLSASLLNAS